MKINKELKEKMISMRNKGISYNQISLSLQIPLNTVRYNVNEEYREQVKKSSRKMGKKYYHKHKKEINKRRKEYMKNYQNKRYHNDPIFREKHKKLMREYERRKEKEKEKQYG